MSTATQITIYTVSLLLLCHNDCVVNTITIYNNEYDAGDKFPPESEADEHALIGASHSVGLNKAEMQTTVFESCLTGAQVSQNRVSRVRSPKNIQ